jgi:hypothetical protein
MKKQYHFVVKFDAETETFEMDYDTQEAVFEDGVIYNPETRAWEHASDNDIDWEGSYYNRAADGIAFAITNLKPAEDVFGNPIYS